MIYVVLGMHKSGTTLISKTLHESGINMGRIDSEIDYYSGQKYERNDIHDVIINMLDSKNKGSLDTIPPFNEMNILKNIFKFKNIIEDYNLRYEFWGFKNPRTIFVYDYIKPCLGKHKLICIYRDLEEVLAHYSKYNIRNILKAIRAWKIYNNKMIDILAKTDVKFILLKYENIMSESKKLKRLESFLKLPLRDCREKNKTKVPSRYIKVTTKYISNLLNRFNVMELKTISNELTLFEKKNFL